jgi:hypothetical protein
MRMSPAVSMDRDWAEAGAVVAEAAATSAKRKTFGPAARARGRDLLELGMVNLR